MTTKIQFLVFAEVLYTGKKGFKAPSEAVHEASYPRIRVLVIEGDRNVWKEKRSDGGTCDGCHGRVYFRPISHVTTRAQSHMFKSHD